MCRACDNHVRWCTREAAVRAKAKATGGDQIVCQICCEGVAVAIESRAHGLKCMCIVLEQHVVATV